MDDDAHDAVRLAEGVTHLFGFQVEAEEVGYAIANPPYKTTFETKLLYSAAICLGAGGGLARSAASWA